MGKFKEFIQRLGNIKPEKGGGYAVEVRANQPINAFSKQPNRMYQINGGEESQLISACPSCGGPYQGECEKFCSFCDTSRAVYWQDVTRIDGAQDPLTFSATDSISLPDITGSKIEIGEYSNIQLAIGKQVTMQDGSQSTYVLSNVFVLGDNVSATHVMSDEIKCVYSDDTSGFTAVNVMGRNVEIPSSSQVDNLIILDSGTIYIGEQSSIETLYLGANLTEVIIADYVNINHIVYSETVNQTFGESATVENSCYNRSEFTRVANNLLNQMRTPFQNTET